MKKFALLTLFLVMLTKLACCQYRPYHREDLKKYKKKTVKTFQIENVKYGYGFGSQYRPQKFQGMQVISVNRAGGTHDDVYFVDKNGNTQYHTIRPTAPINTHPNGQTRYDSFTPSGNPYQSFGQAIIDGAATLLSELLIN